LEAHTALLRTCLGGLRLRLHERLRPEPCQTVEIAPASGVEPELEPLAAFKGEVEPRFCGFTWLQLEIHQRSYFAKRFLKRLNSAREATPPEENQSRSRFRMSRSPAKQTLTVVWGEEGRINQYCSVLQPPAQHASMRLSWHAGACKAAASSRPVAVWPIFPSTNSSTVASNHCKFV
jgi:hypothetical protein